MSVATTRADRLHELSEFVTLAKSYLTSFEAPCALQLNFACPNAGLHFEELEGEIIDSLDIAQPLGIPLVPNFNPLVPVELLKRIARYPQCDAFWIANTIPYGDPHINWYKLFGSYESPLLERGFSSGGGLSGPDCLPVTVNKVIEARKQEVTTPIVAGNGIQLPSDILQLHHAGASAVAIGSVDIVRPLWMRPIIRTTHTVFK